MASAVATPLEKAFSNIAGIDSMVSTSGQGATAITMQFDLARNIDGAALDVESEISAAERYLPPQLPAPPSFIKLNPADQPVMNLALVSDTMPLYDDGRICRDADGAAHLDAAGRVPGAGLSARRNSPCASRPIPRRLAAKGLSFDDVDERRLRRQIRSRRSGSSTARISVTRSKPTINSPRRRRISADRRRLSQRRAGARQRRREGRRQRREQHGAAGTTASASIILAILRQPDANTVEVVDSVKALLPVFRAQIPPSVASRDAGRPLDLDPQLGQRRAVHADADRRAWS